MTQNLQRKLPLDSFLLNSLSCLNPVPKTPPSRPQGKEEIATYKLLCRSGLKEDSMSSDCSFTAYTSPWVEQVNCGGL